MEGQKANANFKYSFRFADLMKACLGGDTFESMDQFEEKQSELSPGFESKICRLLSGD